MTYPRKNDNVIITGVHMDLTDAIQDDVILKCTKLFRHEERIIRLRVELIHETSKTHQKEFIAKGILEINGPKIVVSVATPDLYKSIDELMDKLDRQLAVKAGKRESKRHDSAKE